MKQRPGDQKLPHVNDRPSVQSLVINDLREREKVGIERYGTALQPFNHRDVERDLYEELLDAVCYARQQQVETDETRHALIELALADGPVEVGRAILRLLEIGRNLVEATTPATATDAAVETMVIPPASSDLPMHPQIISRSHDAMPLLPEAAEDDDE